MNYRSYLIAIIFLLALSFRLSAQTNFYLSGLGRAVVTNDKLGGNLLASDSSSDRRGAGGYSLFDLKANLDVNKNFRGNAILRVRNSFGAFWGLGASLSFRQLQLIGTIEDKLKYEIGDINVGMTPYTVYNFDEMYNKYESDIHKTRRNILEYENFISENDWRLQGVQLSTGYLFKKGIEKLGIKAFGTRTNPTNEFDIPDRILGGLSLNVIQSKYFEIGANYVGLLDIPIQKSLVNYKNDVITGTAKFNFEKEKLKIVFQGETGFSNYNYENSTAGKVVASSNDFFYDLGINGTYKPLDVKIFASYKDVGPQFTSPAAQTRRINTNRAPSLFEKVGNGLVPRQQALFDRFTDERIYNRAVSPVLLPFLPQYNNISPYGVATPNRRGFTFGASREASKKIIGAEVIADMQKEVVGEGDPSVREFIGIKGGALFNLGQLIKFKKTLTLNGGIRNESTKRSGNSPIDFKSTLIDAGLTWELVNKIDLLVGAKKLYAKGNEFLYSRDEFNVPQTSPPNIYIIDSEENIYSLGARVRFSQNAFFILSYNTSQVINKSNTAMNYHIHQVFANYTISF